MIKEKGWQQGIPGTVEESWSLFRDEVYDVSLQTLGKAPKKTRHDWFEENDAAIEQLLDAKRLAYRRLQSAKCGRSTRRSASVVDALAKEYRKECGRLRAELKAMKDRSIRRMAEQLQQAADRHDPSVMFQIARNVTGPIIGSTGAEGSADATKLLEEPQEVLRRWQEYSD